MRARRGRERTTSAPRTLDFKEVGLVTRQVYETASRRSYPVLRPSSRRRASRGVSLRTEARERTRRRVPAARPCRSACSLATERATNEESDRRPPHGHYVALSRLVVAAPNYFPLVREDREVLRFYAPVLEGGRRPVCPANAGGREDAPPYSRGALCRCQTVAASHSAATLFPAFTIAASAARVRDSPKATRKPATRSILSSSVVAASSSSSSST